MRGMMLVLGSLGAVLVAGPALADRWDDDRGRGRGHGGKEEFWDGACKVERKWKRDGSYKEERKCRAPQAYRPAPVYGWGPAPVPGWGPPPHAQGWGPPVAAPVPGPGSLFPSVACNRDLVGGLIGGAAGGLLGSQIGRGDGNTAATVGGVVIGALLGGALGRSMDEGDAACLGQALEYGGLNQPVSWRTPQGGQYEVTSLRDFLDSGRNCRAFRTTAVFDGRPTRVDGTACRGPDGVWRVR